MKTFNFIQLFLLFHYWLKQYHGALFCPMEMHQLLIHTNESPTTFVDLLKILKMIIEDSFHSWSLWEHEKWNSGENVGTSHPTDQWKWCWGFLVLFTFDRTNELKNLVPSSFNGRSDGKTDRQQTRLKKHPWLEKSLQKFKKKGHKAQCTTPTPDNTRTYRYDTPSQLKRTK